MALVDLALSPTGSTRSGFWARMKDYLMIGDLNTIRPLASRTVAVTVCHTVLATRAGQPIDELARAADQLAKC